jgi:hypothetical protein
VREEDTTPPIELTDAAEELSAIWSSLLSDRKTDDQLTYKAVANWAGIDATSFAFPRVLGILAKRAENLSQLIQNSRHPLLSTQYRNDLISGIHVLNTVLLPSNMHQNWKNNKARAHPAQISLISSFSHIARSYRPLRKIAPKEARGLIEQGEKLLEGLEADGDVAPWATALVRAGLEEVIFSLKHLPQLGTGYAVETIEKLAEDVSKVRNALELSGDMVAPTSSGRNKIVKMANIAIFALNLISVPPQAEEYANWYWTKLNSVSFPFDQRELPESDHEKLLLIGSSRQDEDDD